MPASARSERALAEDTISYCTCQPRPCFHFGAQFKRKEDLHFLTLIKNSTYFEPPPISTNLLVKQKGLCRHTEAWDRDVSCCKAQSLLRQSRESCAQRMQLGNGHQKPRFKPSSWTASSQKVLIPSAVTQILTSSTVANAFQKEPHLSASHTLSVPFALGAGSTRSVREFNINPPNGGRWGVPVSPLRQPGRGTFRCWERCHRHH